MRQPVSTKVAQTLRELAAETPVSVRVSGECMAPLLESGAMIHVIRQRETVEQLYAGESVLPQ